ncbi:MAG: efflux RND transporter periplasmic adaptor subunit, partial [Bryobacteraceae bacterium]|nr:efflux RND transporter periplasmic adaptor subunit [Bryobacteraceae bacterium]
MTFARGFLPGAAVLAALALSSCGGEPKSEAQDARPVPSAASAASRPGYVNIPADSPQLKQIRSEPVAMSLVPVGSVSAPGKVEANANRLSHVVLPLTGRITTVLAKIGDFVRQGQPVL